MNPLLFILLWSPGLQELLVVVVIILLLFGGRKIPELMKGLGKGVKEFKDATGEEKKDKGEKSSSASGNKDN